MRTIIFSTGTSILGGLKKQGIELPEGNELSVLTRQQVEAWGKATDRLATELSTLAELKATAQDKAVFLTTDTDNGKYAGKLLAHLAELRFGMPAQVDPIDGLGFDNPDTFRRKGLITLVEKLDGHVEQARQAGRTAVLGIGGGIKPMITYSVAYGMLRQVPITYVFEFIDRLITLPRLPLNFDWEALRAASRALAEVREQGVVTQAHLRNLLGNYYTAVEGLFEVESEDAVTLSPFGLMVLSDLEQSEQTNILLSPRAGAAFAKASGLVREQFGFLLARLRNPLWRSMKYHPFPGTDLDVWKPGNTSQRMAGWVELHAIYVAELYPTHDEYVRDLPAQKRKDYDPDQFMPWQPAKPVDPLTSEEAAGDALMIRSAQLEKEREEALEMAARWESALQDSRQENGDMRGKLAAAQSEIQQLEAKHQTMRSWSLMQRLRWALFGAAT